MFQVTIRHPESAPRVESITDTSAIIGKGRECRLRLPGWKIGREHARIYRSKTGLYIQDLGQLFGTTVNGARIQQHGPIAPTDQIVVGPFTLVIEDSPTGVLAGVAAGMTTVGLCAGGHIRDGHAQALNKAGALKVFDSYADLATWIASKPQT